MAALDDILLCCFLMIVTMFVAYLTKKYQFIYLPESASAMLLGMMFGAVSVLLFDDSHLKFDHQTFFYGLLPIIIFNAGYSLKRKDFFRNFTTILLFAVVGTIVSSLVFGLLTYFLYLGGIITHLSAGSPLLESLIYGSLISAIDPIATLSVFQDVAAPTALYNLVFGESLVNDASSIVLFRTFVSFLDKDFTFATIGVAIVRFIVITVASTALGIGASLFCALLLKFIDTRAEYAKFELAFILLSAYVAYAMAEIFSLSGIMALFFCGICNAHYGYYNASQASKISSKYAFEALAFLAELFVFAYLGMQVVVLQHEVDAGLLLSALPLCLLSRALNIFPLSWLANKGRRLPITNSMKVMMWLCGLRGAIAYALAINIPTYNRSIETATLFIVVTTTLIFGSATAPMLRLLGLTSDAPLGNVRCSYPLSNVPYEVEDLHHDWGPRSIPHALFKWIDSSYMKPFFGGRAEDLDEPWLKEDDQYNEPTVYSGQAPILSSDDEFCKTADVTLLDMPPPGH